MTTDPKESTTSKSSTPRSQRDLNDDTDPAMDSIVVEPLSPLPPPDGLSPPPPGQEDISMNTPSPEEDTSMSDPNDNDGDDEDDEGSEMLEPALPGEYIVPLKDGEELDSTMMSEASLSVNGQDAPKLDISESLTRGGKLRKLAPPVPRRRKTPNMSGRSRTPRAPSPVIPPRGNSPWPDIPDSDIRDTDHHSTKRRRTTTRNELNGIGIKESTPMPSTSRVSRRGGKDDPVISAEERMKRSKRVKISPRKEKQQPNRQRSPPHPLTAAQDNGTGTQRFVINMKQSEKEEADPTRYNEEICGACGGPGRFLCCEGCPKSFHFTCLDPPIDENELPEDSWYDPIYMVDNRYCNSCRALREPLHHSDNRLFDKLIDKMNRLNPVAYRLPKDIRNYFDGITTGEDGEYQETHEVKPMRANARGFVDEPDPFRLRDKSGRPIFCYRCGDTASSARRMLSCDHCSMHWHMDCLDPPLTALPPLTKKWMCPLHASHAYRRMRRPKHKLRVVDVSLPRGFRNSGDIEIENDESSEEEQIGHKLLEDGFESDFSIDGTTYRLPEKGIKLDFLEKIKMCVLMENADV
jgi:hypothetical protein